MSESPFPYPFSLAGQALHDYFQNDREGWVRGYAAWAESARKALGVTSCKYSIYDPDDVTDACVLPLGHEGPHVGMREDVAGYVGTCQACGAYLGCAPENGVPVRRKRPLRRPFVMFHRRAGLVGFAWEGSWRDLEFEFGLGFVTIGVAHDLFSERS